MADSIELSVVVPAYKEELRLGPTLDRIREYLAGRDGASEIIVVDDGSSDRTSDVALEHLAGFPYATVLRNEPNAGKGYSVRRGMLASRGSSPSSATPISRRRSRSSTTCWPPTRPAQRWRSAPGPWPTAGSRSTNR